MDKPNQHIKGGWMFKEGHFLSNCWVDHRLIGVSPMMSPFAANDSSQRLTMLSSHLPQALVLNGAQPPEISTGFEMLVGDYEFNPTVRDCDIQILTVIQKYIPFQGAFPIKHNPTLTVIYRRNDNNKIDYFILSEYTKGSDGYGYKNVLKNLNYLNKNSFVEKDIQFQTSPSHKDGMYAMGANIPIAYMTLDGVTEDAFIVSESFAKTMGSMAITKTDFQIGVNQIPLNLYGDEDEYKFMPDINEPIRPDGIICGFRKPDSVSFISDTQISSLSKPQPYHDNLYFVQQPDGVVIDIDVYVNRKCKIPRSSGIFNQIQKYQEQNIRYHTDIVKAYVEARQLGYEITDNFNTLVTRSYILLRAEGKKVPDPNFTQKANITLIQKKDPIEFIHVSITYAHPNNVSAGYKFTGRNGDKGVACIVKPDSEMPIDQYGVRAKMIMDCASVFNRMNSGQWNVQFISRMNTFNRWRVMHMLNGGDITKPFTFNTDTGVSNPVPPVVGFSNNITPYEFVMSYLKDINPNYEKLIREKCILTKEDEQNFLNDIVEKGFYLVMPPFLKHINSKWVLYMNEKYPCPATPVTFISDKADGTKKNNSTIDPVFIGNKYVYCLYRIPKIKAAGPGYINQHKTPIHPSGHAKLQYPVFQTPLRHGEDEIRNQSMAAGPAATARMMALNANSAEGLNTMMEMLITAPNPTNIERVPISTHDLIESNNINCVTQHMFSTFGVNITKTVDENDPRYEFTLNLNKKKKI